MSDDQDWVRWNAAHWNAEAAAATARAERAELLVRSVDLFGTGFLWKRPDGTEHVLEPSEVMVVIAADQQSEREQLTARAERAEAAIQRGLRLADEIENGPGVAHLRLLIAQQLLAALDSTDPVEDAPMAGPCGSTVVDADDRLVCWPGCPGHPDAQRPEECSDEENTDG